MPTNISAMQPRSYCCFAHHVSKFNSSGLLCLCPYQRCWTKHPTPDEVVIPLSQWLFQNEIETTLWPTGLRFKRQHFETINIRTTHRSNIRPAPTPRVVPILCLIDQPVGIELQYSLATTEAMQVLNRHLR